MSKALLSATALAAASVLAHAQTPPATAPATAPAAPAAAAAPASVAPLPSTPAKRELAARILRLQQPGIELMGRSLAEQPAMQLMQQAGAALQQVPPERREALARDIEADIRKYVDEAGPIVANRAVQLAPSTVGTLLEERLTEAELREVVTLLESPANRKFQSLAGEMQRVISQRVVADTRGDVEARVRAMQQSVSSRLQPANGGAPAPAAAPAPAPRQAPAAAASAPRGQAPARRP